MKNEYLIDDNVLYVGESVFEIKRVDLPKEPFEKMIIPITITKIEEASISCQVIYDGVLITKEEISKYGCDNIPRISFLKQNSVFEFLVEKGVWQQVPLDKDAIKAFQANYRLYEILKEQVSNKKSKSLYPLCHILGLFSISGLVQKRIYEAITNIYEIIPVGELDNAFSDFKLPIFNLKMAKILLMVCEDGHLFDILPYIKDLCENKETLNIIETRKKQDLSHKNTMFRKCQDEQEKNSLLLEIEQLKINIKNITWEDICSFYTVSQLTVRPGNEELNKIIPILLKYINNQEQFDILQDIYEESLKLSEVNPATFKDLIEQDSEISYEWLKPTDVKNLILGYLVNCCAKVGELGIGILHLSMTNPNVRTMIIYKDHKIIGKATAYYNPTDKYLLFNNIEMSHFFLCSAKISDGHKKKVLDAILRGIQAQVDAIGDIMQVRIGMDHNDLEEIIKDSHKIADNVLPNIRYDQYKGDASEHQAIIPVKGR